MVDATTTTLTIDEPSITGVSWGAVYGSSRLLAVTLVVLAFGTGLGLSVVSPWETAGVSATTFKIGTGIFLIVVAMFSSSIGGYLAGRLRTRWIGVQSDEVYFSRYRAWLRRLGGGNGDRVCRTRWSFR